MWLLICLHDRLILMLKPLVRLAFRLTRSLHAILDRSVEFYGKLMKINVCNLSDLNTRRLSVKCAQ